MKYPHLCCSFFRPFFSLMCAFSNVSLLRRVFVFSRRISWESSTFCRCKHLSIRSPFVACLFSFAAFLGKARPFADAGTCLMFCPWKKSCAVGRIGLYTFLRFASSPRRICSTRIWNEMNIKCRMALGASDQQLNIRTQRRPKLTKTGKSAIRSQTMENSHISTKK